MRLARNLFTFVLLLGIKMLSTIFFRIRMRWIGETPEDPWADLRLVAILNHTSLYEPVFAGGTPPRFLWAVARHAVVPVAKKTTDRPLVGTFFKVIAGHVVPITRKRDQTWAEVLDKVDDPRAMVIILPEGRMKRPNGLDSEGKPMTVRGGVADLIETIPEGRLLIAYSEGLHHVQAPGEHLPRIFRTVRMKLENLDLARYRREMKELHGEKGFRRGVIQDFTRRRDLHCPPESNHPEADQAVPPEPAAVAGAPPSRDRERSRRAAGEAEGTPNPG